MPRASENGVSAFTPKDEQASHLLGAISAEVFTTYFVGKNSSPLTWAEKKC